MSESKQGPTVNGDSASSPVVAASPSVAASVPRVSGAESGRSAEIPNESRHADDRQSEVGEFIRSQRQRANLSLRRLADRAGISNPYLSQIERGVRKPSAEILKRISRALSISAETLYTRAGLIEGGPTPLPVIDAIEADALLSPRQKQVLLDVYRTLISPVSGLDPDTDT